MGEYAVLTGSPALVLAVNRRARVTVQTCTRSESHVEVPQLGLGPVRFRLESGRSVTWLDGHADQPAFRRARQTLEWWLSHSGEHSAKLDGLQLRIDTEALYQREGGQAVKLGLGSSAAMTVALAAALEAVFHPAPEAVIRERLQSRLLEPYRAGQGGQGSGIDLAASLNGGFNRYQLDAERGHIRPADLPPGLLMAFVWVGVPASTPDFLVRFERWHQGQQEQARKLLQSMDECCQSALACLDRKDAQGLMTCINKYRRHMGKIGQAMGAPVLSEQLDGIISTAKQYGLACKPCGAGGGDIALLAGTERPALEQAVRRLGELGHPDLRLSQEPAGLQIDTEAT